MTKMPANVGAKYTARLANCVCLRRFALIFPEFH